MDYLIKNIIRLTLVLPIDQAHFSKAMTQLLVAEAKF